MTFFRAAARAGGLAAALFAAAGVAGPAAADDSVFRIAGVAVDATAETVNAAREIAIARGHALAFRRLVARIVRTADAQRVPGLSHAEVAPMVRSFEVADEKTSTVRYLARLSFQFDRGSVRRFLRANGTPVRRNQRPAHAGPAGAAQRWHLPVVGRTQSLARSLVEAS